MLASEVAMDTVRESDSVVDPDTASDELSVVAPATSSVQPRVPAIAGPVLLACVSAVV